MPCLWAPHEKETQWGAIKARRVLFANNFIGTVYGGGNEA